MARPKKDGIYINCKLDAAIVKQLEEYCDQTGLSKTVTIEKALQAYFKAPQDLTYKAAK